jgi:hypothetical protein
MSENDRIGTLAWARRTGGKLTPREEIRLLLGALRSQSTVLPVMLGWLLGLKRVPNFDLDEQKLMPPDSRAAKEAEALCRELSTEALTNHCFRTYLWGKLLANQQGLKFDDELLYTACLLHDIGITEKYATNEKVTCFTLDSAEVALSFADRMKWDRSRQLLLAEAITLHMNVTVTLSEGIEAHLLQAGAGFDVAGLRYWELSPQVIKKVLTNYPRCGFKLRITEIMAAQAKTRPHSRASFICNYLMFPLLIKMSPYQD